MRATSIILLLFILSCKPSEVKDELFTHEARDSSFTNTLQMIADARKTVSDSLLKDPALRIAYGELIIKYDTLLAQAIRSENEQPKLIAIKNKFIILQRDNKELLSKLKQEKNDLTESIGLKKMVSESLRAEKIYSKSVVFQRNVAQSKLDAASKLKVADVKIQAYYFPRMLGIGKKNKTETFEAKKTKQIEVTFVPVENALTSIGNYVIVTTLKQARGSKGLQHTTIYSAPGFEGRDTVRFDEPTEWQVGKHMIDISVNNMVIHTDSITLK